MKPSISVDAHARYLVVPSVAAGLVIVLVLFALSRIPSAISLLAFVLLSAAVAAGFAVEILLWQARGIRRVELSGETLIVHAGRALSARRVQRRSVLRLRVTSRLGRRAATLFLESGGRLRVSSDAFPEEAFARVLAALKEWGE